MASEAELTELPQAEFAADRALDAHVGARLKILRTQRGLSQSELGRLLGITFQQIQKYENGANRIGAGRLWQIAQICAVDCQYFFDGIDQIRAEEASSFSKILSRLNHNDWSMIDKYASLSPQRKRVIQQLVDELDG